MQVEEELYNNNLIDTAQFPDNYKEFLENKYVAFYFFSIYSKDRINQSDKLAFERYLYYRQSIQTGIFIGSVIGIYRFDKHIVRNNIVIGMTFASGFTGTLLKYYVAPMFTSRVVDIFLTYPVLRVQLNKLVNKYNIDNDDYQEIWQGYMNKQKSDPYKPPVKN